MSIILFTFAYQKRSNAIKKYTIMTTFKVLSVETLKSRILKAIKAGNNETKYIIESCGAELFYCNFCKALAELQCEDKVIYKEGLGYYLA